MFKQKNKKIIQCDSRITLDAKHNEIIKNFKEEQKNIKKYYLELKSEEDKLDKTQMDNSIALNPEDLTAIFEKHTLLLNESFSSFQAIFLTNFWTPANLGIFNIRCYCTYQLL